MAKRSHALMLGLLFWLSACAQPSGTSPTASDQVRTLDGGPTYHLQQTMAAQAQVIIEQINESRQSRGFPALTPFSTLRQLAQEHSGRMVSEDAFEWTEGDTVWVASRLFRIGFTHASSAHLIRVVRPPLDTVGQRAVHDDPDGWLVSPASRTKVFDATMKSIGVGITYHPREDQYYITGILTDRPIIRAR